MHAVVDRPGVLEMTFKPADGSAPKQFQVRVRDEARHGLCVMTRQSLGDICIQDDSNPFNEIMDHMRSMDPFLCV